MSDALHQISLLAQLLIAQQAKVAALELELAAAKEAARLIEQEDLPMAMKEVELTEFKLEDGSKVSLAEEVQCGITEERRPAAHAWLALHSFDGIIKTSVAVLYDRGEREQAQTDAATIVDTIGRPATVGETIHPQTLKAFIKERMADPEGPQPPADLFGIFPFTKAKIAAPKTKK